MIDTPLIAKIKKLLALANSPNVHEAASAAAEAQRLMLEHQVESASLVDGPAPVVRDAVQEDSGRGRACMWRALLAKTLGDHLCVSVIYITGSDRIDGIGRGPDVAALCVLYAHVSAQLVAACEAEWAAKPRALRNHLARNEGGKLRFIDTFMRGARDAISERMAEQRRSSALEIDARSATWGPLRGTALIRMNRYAEEAREAISAWRRDSGLKTRTTTRRTYSQGSGAYGAGQAAGRDASLTPNNRALPGR